MHYSWLGPPSVLLFFMWLWTIHPVHEHNASTEGAAASLSKKVMELQQRQLALEAKIRLARKDLESGAVTSLQPPDPREGVQTGSSGLSPAIL